MGYYLYGYGGSGDHESEDRIRGTCRLLPCQPELCSTHPEEDWHYGLASVAALTRQSAAKVGKGDVCLTADPNGAVAAKKAGAKAVLWCWSPAYPLKGRLRRAPDAVVVPDRHSLEYLCRSGLQKKARLGPDPGFLVERLLRPLDGGFCRDTIGLCFSAAVDRYERKPGLLFESYSLLIRYLLSQTDFEIALIPYCAKPWRDDRVLLQTLYERFQDSGRVRLRPDGESRVLRGDIGMCRMVIGSAGAVAAWSCGVPALCIGADFRAMGLAKELLGQWQGAVLPVAWLKDRADLTRAVREFFKQEDNQRRALESAVPSRRQQALSWDWDKMMLMG